MKITPAFSKAACILQTVSALPPINPALASKRMMVPSATPLCFAKSSCVHRRRREYGAVKGDQVRKMKDLEVENARLRRPVCDQTLGKIILKEAASGTVGPRQRNF